MSVRLGGLSVNPDGTVTQGADDNGGETNVAIWTPALPTAFDNARNAVLFTRIGTRHSQPELKAAFDATPYVDQTFCLSVNNLILIFSVSRDEHIPQVKKVLEMLRSRSMSANIRDSVFNAETSTDAGIRLDQVGNHKAYMVINEGMPRRS